MGKQTERHEKPGFYPPYHYFCCDCDRDKKMTMKELIAHVAEMHDIDLKGKQAVKKLLFHINRRPRHASVYELQYGGLTFYEHYG